MMKNIIAFPKNITLSLIALYQATISPDHGLLKTRYPQGFCRHYPSCSEYSKQAFIRFGFLKGMWLSFKRVMRCNPFAKPKVDLVPNS